MDNKNNENNNNSNLSNLSDDDEPALDLDVNVLQHEVATIKYVSQNTCIKVPEVYDWDCTLNNPIKRPYILMERLPRQYLYRVWDKFKV
ncbi:kinase-like domain-containing protein [Rhizophagus clarus]|uniref:Altered inheritance of mitochondria protein 9, mitochondrial n=1 Tax=Rhizophagus clarus TaxID=94130 RepID=A0A8H3QDF8_9GLOM|nr:kinase-like domain-containing protein [Rhizophagus clarus]